MKSIAAYYVFIAANSVQQDADRRRAELQAARAPRPSLFARARTLIASSRSRSRPRTPPDLAPPGAQRQRHSIVTTSGSPGSTTVGPRLTASGGADCGSTHIASSRSLNTTQSVHDDEIVSSGPPGHVSRGSAARSVKQSSHGPAVGVTRRPVAMPVVVALVHRAGLERERHAGTAVDAAAPPRVPAHRGRHRLVRGQLQRRPQAVRLQLEPLGDGPRERPRLAQADRHRVARDVVPRPIEHDAVDRVRGHVQRQPVVAAAERELAAPDPAGERHHRVAAPPDRARRRRGQSAPGRRAGTT